MITHAPRFLVMTINTKTGNRSLKYFETETTEPQPDGDGVRTIPDRSPSKMQKWVDENAVPGVDIHVFEATAVVSRPDHPVWESPDFPRFLEEDT